MLTLKTTLKTAPLCCCLFLLAAEDDCTIRIIGPEPDDCVSREEFCPELACDEYAVDEDGCELCECVVPPDPTECSSDADCPDGQFCAFIEACPPCADEDPACMMPCQVTGICTERQPDPCADLACPPGTWCEITADGQAQCIGEPGCWSDFDCAEGEVCIFDQTCPGNPGGLVACAGQCVPSDLSCANVRCEFGTHCEETSSGPVCVADPSQCEVDSDCGINQHCEQLCMPDPNCPECDMCMMVGVCVDDGCPALCGPGSECVINDDGTVGCVPVEPRCYSDQDCAAGSRCNATDICLPPADCTDPTQPCPDVCTGFCVAPTCSDDSQCAADEICVLESNCGGCDPAGGNCLVPCFLEGHCQPRQ